MIKNSNRKAQVQKRQRRIRAKLKGTSEAPRLAVHRSMTHIYAHIIDDVKGVTLVSASSDDKELRAKLAHGGNIEAAKLVGETLAKRAAAKNIVDVVFDRGGFVYHGRVAALADAAREGGLNF